MNITKYKNNLKSVKNNNNLSYNLCSIILFVIMSLKKIKDEK